MEPKVLSSILFLFCKVLKKIAKYIQEQNEKIYAPRGLLITDPIERGMRVVSLSTAGGIMHARALAFIHALQMTSALLYTSSLFPDTNFHQIEISIYEDRGSSGSSSGSSSVSSSTARWLPCAPPCSSSWIFIRLRHMIRYLVLNKFTERIHILLTGRLGAPGVLRHGFPRGCASKPTVYFVAFCMCSDTQ